jgi:hypothetical protein
LFLVSYAPLAAMFALQSDRWWVRLTWGGVSLLGLIDGIRLTYGQRRKAHHKASLTGIRDRGGDVSGYLATYLLPFISDPPGGWVELCVYLLYFVVAWVVYVRSDLVLINPTLYVLGWHVVEGKRPTSEIVLLLCRDTPADGEQVKVVGLLKALVRTDRPSRP